MSLEFCPCKTSDIEKVVEFYRNSWSADHIFIKDPAFMQWQFDPTRSKIFDGYGLSAVTVWDTSKNIIVGFLGMICCDFKVGTQIVPGYWLCNVFIDQAYKTQGIGIKLLHKALKLPVNVVATAGINPDIFRFFNSMKYYAQERANRYIKIITPNLAQTLVVGDLNSTDIDVRVNTFSNNTQYIIEELVKFDSQWDVFWNEITSKGDYIGTNRDSLYMNWRYIEHPYLKYNVILLKTKETNKIIGYAVYRIEQVANFDIKVLRIIEVMIDKSEYYYTLISYIESLAKEHEVAYIDYHTKKNNHPIAQMQGWFEELQYEQLIIPNLFQPLYKGRHRISTAYKFINFEPKVSGEIRDNLYFAKSDGDQDRPN